MPLDNLVLPSLSAEKRDVLRTMLRDRAWTGDKPVANLTKSELRDALESVGVTQHAVDAALCDASAGSPTASVSSGSMRDVVRGMFEDSLAMLDDDISDAAAPASVTGETDMEDVPTAVARVRRTIASAMVEGDFATAEACITELVTASRKAPVVQTVYVDAPAANQPAALADKTPHAVRNPKPSRVGDLFGLDPACQASAWPIATYAGGASVPAIDPHYVFDQRATQLALVTLRPAHTGAQSDFPCLCGPAGTGKSSWAAQFAARTGRPLAVIACNDALELTDIIGSRDPRPEGLGWTDAILTRAVRQPGTVIVLDEIAALRESVAIGLNDILERRILTIPETGEVIPFAEGVIVIATNNDLLVQTSAGRQLYAGLRRQNMAFADRFQTQIWFDYPDEKTEARMLRSRVPNLTPVLADKLVATAGATRAKAKSDDVTRGIGFRRLMAWAKQLTCGTLPEDAWTATILHYVPETDHEAYRQIAASMGVLMTEVIDAALAGKKLDPATVRAQAAAASPDDIDAGGIGTPYTSTI